MSIQPCGTHLVCKGSLRPIRANIARWRRREALRRTLARRPDLLAAAPLTEEERRWLAELQAEAAGARPPGDE